MSQKMLRRALISKVTMLEISLNLGQKGLSSLGVSKKWFLLQFKPNSQRLAERNLQRQGFETFVPLQGMTKSKSSRSVNNLRPLFPGYMFVSFDPLSEPWRKINCTIGVSKLVSFDGQPKSLPLELITGLMLRCGFGNNPLPPVVPNKGDDVELVAGPFANYVAKVESIDVDQRMWVLMDLLGRTTRISVDQSQLQVAK